MKNEQEKSSNRHYFIAAIGIILLCAVVYLRSCGNAGTEKGNSDTGRTVNVLGSGIECSIESNREFQSQLSDAEKSADGIAESIERSTETVNAAKETANSLDDNLNTAEAAIRKCQSIIADIKGTNERGTQKP